MDWDFLRMRGVLDEVETERKRQFKLYGSNPFNDMVDNMLLVLGAEVGEVSEAMIQFSLAEIKADSSMYPGGEYTRALTECKEKMLHVREELVQVAAVAVATIELIDYNAKYV